MTYLRLSDITRIVYEGGEASLSADDMRGIGECFDFLRGFMADKVIYGINTGFGPMAQWRVPDDDMLQLQYNIIRSHSCGAGRPMPADAVRAAMVSRLMTFAQQRSGISPAVVRQLMDFLNKGLTPYIPEHGSVGASGDLVQLSHLALTLIGEGQVFYGGRLRETSEALREAGLEPLRLQGRDGLSVVNGTSMMTGLGVTNVFYARRLLEWELRASVLMNEIAESYDDFIAEPLNAPRRQEGQQAVAKAMRRLAEGGAAMRKREVELYGGRHDEEVFDHKVQPYYSLRCVPQILGPVLETLRNAERVVENEVNSADDNPIVDPVSRGVYHGGNFHGDYISLEMDKLKMVVAKTAMLAERQLNYLLHDRINGILPPFVNMGRLGLDYGMQACQFTATSTTAECQTLSNPMYVHSIPNNNDNQDIVSMGTNSALLCRRVVDNAYQVLSIHLMAIAQAVDCRQMAERLSPSSRATYEAVRQVFPAFSQDHAHYCEVAEVEGVLRRGPGEAVLEE